MLSQFCRTRTVMIILMLSLILSACDLGTHYDTDGQTVQADWYDLAAAALGWESWEEMTSNDGAIVWVDGDTQALSIPEVYLAAGITTKELLVEIRDAAASDHILEGEMYAARLRTSLYAVQEGLRGNPFAQMYKDPSGRWLAVYLPQGGRWFYGFVDLTKNTMYQICQQLTDCGSFITSNSASELSRHMEGLGWKAVTASQIPGSVKYVFLHRMSWLSRALAIRLNGAIIQPVVLPVVFTGVMENIIAPQTGDGEVH